MRAYRVCGAALCIALVSGSAFAQAASRVPAPAVDQPPELPVPEAPPAPDAPPLQQRPADPEVPAPIPADAPPPVSEVHWKNDLIFVGASQYVSRGVRQTSNRPFASLTARGSKGWLFYQVSGANLDLSSSGDNDTWGAAAFVGGARFKELAGGFEVAVGLGYYAYLGQPDGADYDFAELRLSATRRFGKTNVLARLNYSPEYRGGLGTGWYSQLEVSHPVTPKIGVSAALANQYIDGATAKGLNITSVSAAVSYAVTPKTRVAVRYWDSNQGTPLGKNYGDQLVLELIKVF